MARNPPGLSETASWRVTVLTLLVLGACDRNDPGISREKAEAVLKAYDYSDIELQADPNGWSGTVVPTSGGYRLNVTIDRNGVMQLKPCGCGGSISRLED